jgi:hypothetical protein
MRGSFYLRMTSGQYASPQPYIELNLGKTDLTIYLAPEDLTRVASMLRLAAENIEALIGAHSEKETVQSNVLLFPSKVSRAA